jgi:hypothetical protein
METGVWVTYFTGYLESLEEITVTAPENWRYGMSPFALAGEPPGASKSISNLCAILSANGSLWTRLAKIALWIWLYSTGPAGLEPATPVLEATQKWLLC